MLKTLIRRELLDNLMTFRFAAVVFITLLLVVVVTAVLIQDYERRLDSYNDSIETHRQQLRRWQTYSPGVERLYVDRPPNLLSLFNVGLDKRLGNQIRVAYSFVPSLWDAGMDSLDNSFLNIFSSIDIVFIFEVVLSLLALIFAYDALAGERERGTLRLVLTHPVRRGHILLAKYTSAMLCLLVPLLMSLLLAVILLTTSTSIALSTEDFLRIGGIVVSSLVYLSVFYLIGLLISSGTRRTSTALMLSMFVWGFLVLVYPNMIL
ncbi:MAG: ABC transporter permease, partial [Proteobacteria bacterium]|nr:ABC transporter permease [Pseudomonadota bacterium]